MKELSGTGVAMVTPFNADGTVNFNHLSKLTEHLINGGVEYLVVMGTTAESATLSDTEKKAVLKCVMDTNANRLPIVLGVGGNNTADVCNQLTQLDTTGLTAILSVSPFYNKPTQDGIYAHYKAVSAASPLPIILYNVPGRTGSNVLAATTLRIANDFNNVVAVKEASGDLEQCMAIIKNRPDGFLVISGDDSLSLPIIASGGDGVISVVANAFPQQYSNLIRAAMNNQFSEARRWQYKLLDIIDLLFSEGNPAGVKCALNLLDVCDPHVRLPLLEASSELRTKLKQEIDFEQLQ